MRCVQSGCSHHPIKIYLETWLECDKSSIGSCICSVDTQLVDDVWGSMQPLEHETKMADAGS